MHVPAKQNIEDCKVGVLSQEKSNEDIEQHG